MRNLSINKLSALLAEKKISVKELTEIYLNRVLNFNEKYNTFITVNKEKALLSAVKIQSKIDDGILNNLSGIPYGAKDNICTNGIRTTCASRMLNEFVPKYNASVIDRLSENDAVLIGKLNMDEFAMGNTNETSFFGRAANPWDDARAAGGSSGGSAAAVALRECAFALGSDTGGSIRLPSAYCGVTGMKPTYGLVSRYGLIAHASSMDQIGPIASSAEDCKAVLKCICGSDSKDSTCVTGRPKDISGTGRREIKGLKIAIVNQFFNEHLDREVKEKVREAARVFEQMGVECEYINMPLFEYEAPVYYLISMAEASSNLARFDGIKYGFKATAGSMEEIYMNTRSEGFGQEVKRRIVMGNFVLSAGFYEQYYNKAVKARNMIKREYDGIFDKYDMILGPVSQAAAPVLGEENGNPVSRYKKDSYTVGANLTGCPSITFPCGFSKEGLPIGAMLTGKQYSDWRLIDAVCCYQENTEYHLAEPEAVRIIMDEESCL